MIMMFELDTDVQSKKYVAQEISSKDAKKMVTKYHYSEKVVSNSSLHIGLFSRETFRLVGCLSYGPPMNGEKTSKKISDAPKMFELNRMVMADSEPRNSESHAIGLCNKWLKKNTDVDYLLSFSDGKENNVGYIYQATNWKYLGYLLSNSFYDLDGAITHSVTVWHRYKEKHALRDSHTTHEILCTEFDNVSIIESKQHVYVLPLKKNIKFHYEEKEYPKMDKEVPILSRTWVKRNGTMCSEVESYIDYKPRGILT